VRIFDWVECRLRSVLIITNYVLAGLSFDHREYRNAVYLRSLGCKTVARDTVDVGLTGRTRSVVSSLAWRSLSRDLAFETLLLAPRVTRERVSERVSFNAPRNLAVVVIILAVLFTTFQSRHALLLPCTE